MKTKTYHSLKPLSVLWITTCAVFMALTILLSTFSIPVPGGHLYLCDVPIVTAAFLLDPLGAMLVGGLGSFLGDAMFYPVTMFISLVTHGLQGYAVSWIAHNTFKDKPFAAAVLGSIAGVVIMVSGYTLGKIFVYSTFEYAMIKLPWEILQGIVGAICALLLTFPLGLRKAYEVLERRK